MSLTLHEIQSIEHAAKNLKRWANNLSYSPPSPTTIRLLPDIGQDKVILLLLAKMPGVGQEIKKDFKVLYEMHQEIDSWRGKAITDDEWLEFKALVDTLKGAAYNISEELQQIAQNARVELKSKEREFWTIGGTLKVIFYLLSGFAALLTCIYVLSWLWSKFKSI